MLPWTLNNQVTQGRERSGRCARDAIGPATVGRSWVSYGVWHAKWSLIPAFWPRTLMFVGGTLFALLDHSASDS